MNVNARVEPATASSTSSLIERYRSVRQDSMRLAEPCETEDMVIQSMPDVSPMKWHLAHTTWFFETFLLEKFDPNYQPRCPEFRLLFNSYYNAVGDRHPRPRRGLLSRPTVKEVFTYRKSIDGLVTELADRVGEDGDDPAAREFATILELGLHHEQQHQELMLTDILHVFSCNPLLPTYRTSEAEPQTGKPVTADWIEFPGGIVSVGHRGEGFHYDNEGPAHRVLLRPFALASRPVTNAEYLEFMNDDGYRRPELWLSDGWDAVCQHHWDAPQYWLTDENGSWSQFTLQGLRPLDMDAPACHLSFYEADAYARWTGFRLPTEFEWEMVAEQQPIVGHFADRGVHRPLPATQASGEGSTSLHQLFGDVWEWTASPYAAYPGYRAAEGALGEYNGKFMCNQMVLRGGSCATPAGHIRSTYRNFFQPEKRWQFSGVRLTRDLE